MPLSNACTIFMAEGDGIVLAGNNEDFYLDVNAKMWVTPGKKGEHGRVTFGFDQNRRYDFAQGGMNDKGLFFDAAVTPKGPPPREKNKPVPPKNMGDRMLAECATVEETITWLGKYRLTLLDGGHLLIADAAGDAAVIELIDGEMKVIRKETDKKAIGVTNFSVTKPELGNYPCSRFTKMRDAVKAGPATVEGFKGILQSVAVPKTYSEQDKRYGGTLYSNVYDLTNGVVYLYNRYDFGQGLKVNVAEFLKKGKATYQIDELLPVAV
ncbi:MAG TPA: carcinine hydrolase/isopenicillin-N N-acyltransferase family protein [Candidatus Hydrogenedentes bacterium]|nr:carcinine hydrolase/isopenicillin-N N-acyltransferase family protein [Candidatus Hydrogenedentota bacterium]HRK33647.1 carcinine hydrolase/isopenicillin-N N-acyltransferase family protein [Candidatus Hydrogenedentota bacterium]